MRIDDRFKKQKVKNKKSNVFLDISDIRREHIEFLANIAFMCKHVGSSKYKKFISSINKDMGRKK